MGPKLADKKRKSRDSDSESDDELANGLFDGVLSMSDDDEDDADYASSDEVDEDDEATDASEDDGDDEDDILSDDIPSDADGEAEMEKLVAQQGGLEITEPGVDPKRNEEAGEGDNFRVETDANGGIRYVYECVAKSGFYLSRILTRPWQRNRSRLRLRRHRCAGPCQHDRQHSPELLRQVRTCSSSLLLSNLAKILFGQLSTYRLRHQRQEDHAPGHWRRAAKPSRQYRGAQGMDRLDRRQHRQSAQSHVRRPLKCKTAAALKTY